jgi:RNA polymerase sigma factor (sigma-70 family)
MQAISVTSPRSLPVSTDLPGEGVSNSAEQRFVDYARTGDQAILHGLIEEFSDRAYTQARHIIGQYDGAEDAVQEAFLRLVRTAKKYDGSVPFAAWLGRLVSAAAINHRERRILRHARHERVVETGNYPMTKQSPEDQVESPDIDALRSALDALPDRYRTPLTMYYFCGLNQHETAHALGAPMGTVAARLARGLNLLRQKLGHAGYAVTSAGLLTLVGSLPTYATPPELKAGLLVTQQLTAVKAATALTGAGVVKTALAGALAVVATVTMFRTFDPVTASIPPAVINLERGLVGHWRLDETAGTTAADSSGNQFHGTLGNHSKPDWAAGKINGALNFDGDWSVVSMTPIAGSNLTRYTLAAWIMPRTFGMLTIGSPPLKNLGRILNKRSTGSTAGWSLFIGNHGPNETIGNFQFRQTFSITEGSWATPDNHVALNAWQHVALTYDNGSAENSPVFYINGIPATTVAQTDPEGSVSSDAESTLTIGNTPTLDRTFDGAIDDVRIYNRILSHSEIQELVADDTSSRK